LCHLDQNAAAVCSASHIWSPVPACFCAEHLLDWLLGSEHTALYRWGWVRGILMTGGSSAAAAANGRSSVAYSLVGWPR
jgi:hypothetical protein